EEFDPHTIAAAALQMAYDQTRPSWMRVDQGMNEDPIVEEPRYRGQGGNHYSGAKPKPVIKKAKPRIPSKP
ncbi:MAG TPA: hypothetical protein V6C57_01780, partial [Coleofasciculaceae cyanobacterium]